MLQSRGPAVAIDGTAIVLVSTAICLASHRPAVMAAVVGVVIGARFFAWRMLPDEVRGHGLAAEIGLFAACLVLGAANDWNSVTRHRIYDYGVPLEWPALSLVPLWMLAFWGMILRFVVTLVTWRRLALPEPRHPRSIWIPVFLVGLVLGTRQAIYRSYEDPLWSWLPFAVALVAVLVVLRPDRRRIAMLAVVAFLGPAVEVLYIGAGDLHAYHLGWLFGVPVWIVLWWVLAVLVLEQLLARLAALRDSGTGGRLPRRALTLRDDRDRSRNLPQQTALAPARPGGRSPRWP